MSKKCSTGKCSKRTNLQNIVAEEVKFMLCWYFCCTYEFLKTSRKHLDMLLENGRGCKKVVKGVFKVFSAVKAGKTNKLCY